MTVQITAQDARNKFAEMLNTAVYGKKNVIITRFNKPQAVLIDYSEYERLMNPRLRFSHEEWDKGFEVFDRIRTKNKKLNSKKVERIVDEVVKTVREERRVPGGR